MEGLQPCHRPTHYLSAPPVENKPLHMEEKEGKFPVQSVFHELSIQGVSSELDKVGIAIGD